MRVSIVCSDRQHPGYPYLEEWARRNAGRHEVRVVDRASQLTDGDFLFLISCTEIVPPSVYSRFGHPLVIHESDVPLGRGWSPLAWQVLEGRNEIVVSLLEVADHVDRGAVWKKAVLRLEGHELLDEISRKLMEVKFELVEYALEHHDDVKPVAQNHAAATYYPRRTPKDSELDAEKSIAEQFDLLRIADPRRYPAFVRLRGHVYKVVVEKMEDPT